MYKNTHSIDLPQINLELLNYVYNGYDLHFIHGWFAAYLSSPSDSEEDLLIPTYLVLDESKIKDEQSFSKFIDKLVKIYANLADSIYEQNKLIRPLVDFAKPNTFDPLLFSDEHRQNLLSWLYGYLSGFLAISDDISEYKIEEKILDEKFYPALFTLCIAFFSLKSTVSLNNPADNVKEDMQELEQDLKSMWESEDGEEDVEILIASAIANLDLSDIVGALNDIFYVVRVIDETIYNNSSQQNSLLGKLVSKH